MSEFTHAELKLRFAESLDVIDRLTAELAEVREEYGHKCAKCGSVLQLVRPGKYQCQYCEMESALTIELDRYKQGVEVEVTVDSYDYGDTSFICEYIKLPGEFRGQRVRVLVMKDER